MLRSLFLSTGLLLAGAGGAWSDTPFQPAAAQPVRTGPVLLVDAVGMPVALIIPGQPVAVAAPVATLDPIAILMDAQMREMAAMQQAMTQQMAGLAAAADALPASVHGGTSVVMVSSMNGCSRTIAWRQEGAAAAPTLVADRSSGACAGGSAARAARAPVEITGPARPLPGAPVGRDAPKLTPVVDRHAAPAGRRDTAL